MTVPTAALTGDALLDAVSESMGAIHERYHHRRPATVKTQLMEGELLACVMGGVYSSAARWCRRPAARSRRRRSSD